MNKPEFGKDLGIMHELVLTGRRFCFSYDDWAQLTHNPDLLFRVLRLIRSARTKNPDAFTPIDFSVRPKYGEMFPLLLGRTMSELGVKTHGGSNDWTVVLDEWTGKSRAKTDPQLALCNPGYITLNDPDLLNVNHLLFYLGNPEAMPMGWFAHLKNGGRICFLGTILSSRADDEVVSCLFLSSGELTVSIVGLDQLQVGAQSRTGEGNHLVAYVFHPKEETK